MMYLKTALKIVRFANLFSHIKNNYIEKIIFKFYIRTCAYVWMLNHISELYTSHSVCTHPLVTSCNNIVSILNKNIVLEGTKVTIK